MKQKIFAILLAISLVAGLLPATVLAADANPARFVFANEEKVSNLEVIINQGDAPVYLKTRGNKASKDGASDSDYDIKVTYNAGENPTLYLKGAEIQTYGDGNNDPAITIGSEKAEDGYNDVSVDIVLEKNSKFTHTKTYGAPHILSYITGTLTFSRVKGTLVMGHKLAPNGQTAAIQATGDIVFKDINMTISCGLSGHDRTTHIRSIEGNITVDGGSITITTNVDSSVPDADKPTHKRAFLTEAEEKNIIIQNGAKVKINIKNSIKAFGTKGDVIIKDSTVVVDVASEKGTIFSDYPPVIEGYADGYTALGDDAAYNEDNFDSYKKFSIEPKEVEVPTEPTTKPTEPATEPTTKPTEPATQPTEPATQPTTKPTEPATQPSAPATEPSAPATQPTAPADKNDTQPKGGMDINTIILIVGLAVIVAATAASAVIILKKKKAAEK